MSNVNQAQAQAEASFLDQMEQTGFEGIDRSKFKNQFIGIAGGNHPGTIKTEKEYADFGGKLQPGFAFNTSTKKVYGETIQIIVLKHEELWIENEKASGDNLGAFVSAYAPGTIEVEGSQYKRGDERLRNKATGNPITPTDILYVLVPEDIQEGVAAISFRGTGAPILRDFLTKIKNQKMPNGAPAKLFAYVWELKTQFNRNDDGNWYAFGNAVKPYSVNARPVRLVTNDEGYKAIVPERKYLDDSRRNVQLIGAGADQTYAGASGGAANVDEKARDMGI